MRCVVVQVTPPVEDEQNTKFRSMRGGGGVTSGAGSTFGAASSGDVMVSLEEGKETRLAPLLYQVALQR